MATLKNGQLHVVVKTKKKLEAVSEARLNNGTWHTVSVRGIKPHHRQHSKLFKNSRDHLGPCKQLTFLLQVSIVRIERKLTIEVNKGEHMRLKLPKKVNLSNSMYVGGTSEYEMLDPYVSTRLSHIR